MSISAVSGSTSSIQTFLKKIQSEGGISKNDLTELKSSLSDSTASSNIDDLIDSFSQVDSDSSGTISQSEMQTYTKQMGMRPPEPPSDLTKADIEKMLNQGQDSTSSTTSSSTSSDNPLSKLLSSFDEADTDGNGKISQSEFQAFAQANGIDAPKGPPPGGQGGDAPAMSKEDLTNMLSEKTANGSSDTLLSKLVSSFDEADTDGDGKISQTEFHTFAEANKTQSTDQTSTTTASNSSSGSSSDDSTSTDSQTSATVASTLMALLRAYTSGSYSSDTASLFLKDIAA